MGWFYVNWNPDGSAPPVMTKLALWQLNTLGFQYVECPVLEPYHESGGIWVACDCIDNNNDKMDWDSITNSNNIVIIIISTLSTPNLFMLFQQKFHISCTNILLNQTKLERRIKWWANEVGLKWKAFQPWVERTGYLMSIILWSAAWHPSHHVD